MARDAGLASERKEAAEEFIWEAVEIDPGLEGALSEHVIDFLPRAEGNLEKQRNLGEVAFGAAGAETTRCLISVPRLALRGGESIVLIGPNGAGKTTIYDAIMNLRNADFDTKQGSGTVVYGKPTHVREKLRIARLNQEEVLKQIGHLSARQV